MGIVRKKKGITNKNKNKNNLGNGLSNGISNSYSLQNGGSQKLKPTKNGSGTFKKRGENSSASRLGKLWTGVKKGTAAVGKGSAIGAEAVARSYTTVPVGLAATGIHAATAGVGQLTYRTVKAGLGSLALAPKAIHQKIKLSRAVNKIQQATGEKHFYDYQKKEAKIIAEFQKQQQKHAMNPEKQFELIAKLAKDRSQLQSRFQSSKQGLGTETKLYSADSLHDTNKPHDVADLFKVTDFSATIKERQKQHNEEQTSKKQIITNKYGLSNKKTILSQKEQALESAKTELETHNESIKRATETLDKLKLKTPKELISMKPEEKQTYIENFKKAKENINELSRKRVELSQKFRTQELEHKKIAKEHKRAETAIAKNTKKQKLYTIAELENKALRRRAALNNTKATLTKLGTDIFTKTGKTLAQSGRIGARVAMVGRESFKKDANFFSLGKSSPKAEQQSNKSIGQTFGSKAQQKLIPMAAKGASALLNPVKHIDKNLSTLKGNIKALEDTVLEESKINFKDEKNKLRIAGIAKNNEQWLNLFEAEKKRQANKLKLSNIKLQFEEKKNRLMQVQEELTKRVPEAKIKQVQEIVDVKINKFSDKYSDLKTLKDTNGILNIGALDGNKLNNLLATAKMESESSGNYIKYDLLETIYKLNKNKIQLEIIKNELSSITSPQISESLNI